MYTIIDLETTGGKFNEESIIEVAAYKFDDDCETVTNGWKGTFPIL